jgi:hypothetical protein
MPRRLKGRILNTQRATRLVYLLTVHHLFHILEKAVDDLEGLRRGYPSLVLGESVYPLQYRLDVLLSKELLEKLFCVSFESGNIIHRQRRTYLVFPL